MLDVAAAVGIVGTTGLALVALLLVSETRSGRFLGVEADLEPLAASGPPT